MLREPDIELSGGRSLADSGLIWYNDKNTGRKPAQRTEVPHTPLLFGRGRFLT